MDGKAARVKVGEVIKRQCRHRGYEIQCKCDLGESGEADTRGQIGDF